MPIDPIEPKVEKQAPKAEKKKFLYEQSEKKSSSDTLFVYKVTTIFQDNSILSGIISVPDNSIKFKQTIKGFVFEKKITWDDIKSIKIAEWKAIQSGKQNSKTLLYSFYPSKYRIITKEGKKFTYNQNITYFNKLVLTNDDGSTTFFSYFMDYWIMTGTKSGHWKNTRSTYFNAPTKTPLKKTLVTINFK